MRKSNNNDNNRLLYDPNQRNEKRLGAFSMQETENEENIEESTDIEEENIADNNEEVEDSSQVNQDLLKNVAKTVITKKNLNVSSAAKTAIKNKAKVVAVALLTNPIFWLVVGILFFFFILMIILISIDDSRYRYYNQVCDFNLTTVNITECRVIEESDEEGEEAPPLQVTSMLLDDYVINTAFKYTKGNENITSEGIKALMIILKTNVLSLGNYNNSSKSANISECSINTLYKTEEEPTEEELELYDELYFDVRDYLYLNSGFKGTIKQLSFANFLNLDSSIISEISDSDDNYETILEDLYQDESLMENQDENEESKVLLYDKYLFIGDSRANQTRIHGITSNNDTIYGGGLGYDWFVGSKKFDSKYTNATDGAINGADTIIADGNYNIIINLGINGLSSDPSGLAAKFYAKYVELAEGKWKNHNLFIVAVGPVDETHTSVRNSSVDTFNQTLASLIANQALNNLWFVNIEYNNVEYDRDGTGLHYTKDTYQSIYDSIMSNIGNSKHEMRGYKLYSLADNCDFSYEQPTNNSNTNTSSCDTIPFFTNNLTKSDFIDKVTAYRGSISVSNQQYYDVFIQNAGLIYDLAQKNGINAELIIIRAILEGFSPVSQGYKEYNNYWGTNCVNNAPLERCASYKSFESGVSSYVNMIKGYNADNLLDIYYKNHTAFIGYNWYNPGDNGAGGCVYYDAIKEFLSDERNAVVAEACKKGNYCEEGNCIPTTDEDQLAYSRWHIKNYVNIRKSIFGDFCSIFKQSDPRWGSITLGTSSSTMSGYGCAVTSIAIGIANSGTKINAESFDAGVFIKALNAGNCFTDSGLIYWGCSAISGIAPNVRFISSYSATGSVEDKKELLLSLYNTNRFIVMGYQNETTSGHYVVYQAISEDEFVVKDPGRGEIRTVPIKDFDQFVVYEY